MEWRGDLLGTVHVDNVDRTSWLVEDVVDMFSSRVCYSIESLDLDGLEY